MSVHATRRLTTPAQAAVRGQLLLGDQRREAERHGRRRRDEEAETEKKVEALALRREAGAREQGHEPGRDRHDRLQHEPEVGERIAGVEPVGMGQEQGQRCAEQAQEEDLPEEPGLVVVLFLLPPRSRCRQESANL